MKKILFVLFTMLQTTMFAQDLDEIFQDMSDGQKTAMESILRSLSEKDGSKFVILDGDTVYEQKDSLGFAHAVYVKSITDNAVKKICGVSFGTPYEFVRYALEKKYGSPLYLTPTNISYKDVQYGSEYFNDASFYFESKDEKDDYCLNRIILIKTANKLLCLDTPITAVIGLEFSKRSRCNTDIQQPCRKIDQIRFRFKIVFAHLLRSRHR